MQRKRKIQVMTKQEIFDTIVRVSSEVCGVIPDDVMNGSRKEDVVTARAISVFWLDAAGFSVESIVKCTDRNNANSINSIKAKQEEFWVNKFAYHMLIHEVGKRLLDIAHDIGEDFDIWKPIRHMGKVTGKY